MTRLVRADAALARLVAARTAAQLADAEAWLTRRFPALALQRGDDALRLTGPGLVARAFGGRRVAADPALLTLAADVARETGGSA